MTGLEFIRAVREHDLDVPIVLMTGNPALATAVKAVEYGAFGYLIKPIEPSDLEHHLRRASRLHHMARLKRQALELVGREGMDLGDRASLEARFASALDSLWVGFQPIVSWSAHTVFSYEALARTGEATLARPDDLFRAAATLGRLHDLGRTIRAQVAAAMRHGPKDAQVFVNLHPTDFDDPRLYDGDCPLRDVAGRVVLEVTERAALGGVRNLKSRIRTLRSQGYRIALDDLGAGYAGLTSFTQLEPDIVKLDMTLVHHVEAHPMKRKLVGSMVRLCNELGMLVISEGIETRAELAVIVGLGCDLLQGFLFAHPSRCFVEPCWPD